MSMATHHSRESEDSPRGARRRSRKWRIGLVILTAGLLLWQLNPVIWGASGLVHLLKLGEGPRLFLATLIHHLYHAITATIRGSTR